MGAVTAYREALRGALGQLTDKVVPTAPALPAQSLTWDLRSDRPPGEHGPSLVSVLPNTEGTCSMRMPLLPSSEHTICVPGAKAARVGILPNTEVTAELTVRDGLPAVEIAFSRRVSVHNPLEFAGFHFMNAMCQYDLDKIYMQRDGSIELDGSVRVMHMLRKHYRVQVREPTTSVQGHSVIELCKAAGRTLVNTVPSVVMRPLWFFLPPHDETIGDWESMLASVAPLALPGHLSWKGTFSARHPMVVRLDSADVVLPPQECSTSLVADLYPGKRKVSLITHPGTRIRSASADIDFSGKLAISPRAVVGTDVRAHVRSLLADVFLSNGQRDETLVPVHIDTRAKTSSVANGKATFILGKHQHCVGRLDFNLPAQVKDTHRTIKGDVGEVALESIDLDLRLRGHAVKGPSVRDVQVNLDVPSVKVAAQLALTPEAAQRFNTVTHLPLNIHLIENPQPPVRMEVQYGAPDGGVPRGGAVMAFDMLGDLEEKNLLRLEGDNGRVFVDRMLLGLQGAVRFGSMTRDKRRAIEGDLSVRANQLGARILLKPIVLDNMNLQPGTMLETLPIAEDRSAIKLQCTLEKIGEQEMQLCGVGRASIPVRLDRLAPLDVNFNFGSGPVRLYDATARLRCKPLTLNWSPSGYRSSGDLHLRYEARLKGHMRKKNYRIFSSDKEL